MVQRPRLISPFSLAGLLLAVGVVLVLLFPQHRLPEQSSADNKVDEVSLQYMKSLLATAPDNDELRLQLARAYIAIGQYDNAYAILHILDTSSQDAVRQQALLLQLDILLKLAYAEPPASAERAQKMAQFRQALRLAETQVNDAEAMRQLGRIAEAAGEFQLAEAISVRRLNRLSSLDDLDEAARLALANGHYLLSAQYTWRSRQIAPTLEQKFKYLNLALSTLLAGGLGQTGLDWVTPLPAAEWQREDVLYNLTRLAMASQRPALAAELAVKLVQLDRPEVSRKKFQQANFELAYAAFLANSDLPHGLQLGQMAVSRQPDSVLWRERLAHLAEWSGQPKLALPQWRWLAQHRGKDSDWKEWMRLATDLFDYEAQIAGLEREWKQHGRDVKYARQIVQLYEMLGQPEDALAWLDRNGDEIKYPELLLLSADLLNRMGNESAALVRYRRYLKHNSASPELAVNVSGLMQRNAEYQAAYDVLMRSKAAARDNDKVFWNNLGELAWMLKHNDTALMVYQKLSDAPDAQVNQQLRLVQLLKADNAKVAAQAAEKYWRKQGAIELFMSAAEGYAALNDQQSLQQLYRQTDSAKWRDYEANQRFVMLRAEMNKQSGNLSAAERDYRLLVGRNPADLGLKQAYLWMLIEMHSLSRLDVMMQQWSGLLAKTPLLWDVYAAGHLALSRPQQALVLYERMAKAHEQDELWLLNYASTLEMCGQLKRAEKIRKTIWQQRESKQPDRDWLKTSANANDIESLRLLLLQDPVRGQGVLWKLLREGSAELKQNSQFIELAMLWLNEHGQNDAGRAWLIRQYAHSLNAPLTK